jgi:hypothetical protein
MAAQSDRPRPHGDPLKDEVVNNPEENRAQRDSDAPADVIAERPGDRMNSDRANGRGSDATGVPEFDEADAERRRKLYDEGADLVSRID